MEHDKTYKPIDFTTWCSPEEYPAGKIVATILNELEDNGLTKKVTHHINRFYNHIHDLEKLEKFSTFYMIYLFKSTKETIFAYGYPKPLESHLINFITGIYRNKRKTKLNSYKKLH